MPVKDNILKLKQELKSICDSCGRDVNDILIVAVSKTKPAELVFQAYEAGQRDFGENYIQEALEKAERFNEYGEMKWHFIGNLQSNKVKYLTRFCSLFHSLDSENIAEVLQKRLQFENKTMDVLIQVNTSGEASKSGVAVDGAVALAEKISGFDRLKVKGLMTIAENSDDETLVRENYRTLKRLFDEIKILNLPNAEMKHLSMGMSGDYNIAVEEGATIIRIGSNIFGERPKKKVKLNRLEMFIVKHTPAPVKRALNWMIDRLPDRCGKWIRDNRFLSICIVYTIRGLFFRPSMWAVYAAVAAYFGYRSH